MTSQWMQQLESEGFTGLFVKECSPNEDFPEHTHPLATVHVILEGAVDLIENGETLTLNKGDHFVIPAGTTHRARAGAEGCSFIVGTQS